MHKISIRLMNKMWFIHHEYSVFHCEIMGVDAEKGRPRVDVYMICDNCLIIPECLDASSVKRVKQVCCQWVGGALV